MKTLLLACLLLSLTGCATSQVPEIVARQQALIERQQRTIGELLTLERQQILMMGAMVESQAPTHTSSHDTWNGW